MADADEDAIPTTSSLTTSQNDEDAASDEDGPFDYRFLTKSTPSSLPKRGTKDFEPNPTRVQSSALDASREAMHNALSAMRVHPGGKAHNVGIYIGERERLRDPRFRVRFEGEEQGTRCVLVCKWKSKHTVAMGRMDRRAWTWLNAEEALYLVERGSLDVRWGDDREEAESVEGTDEEESEPEPPELPMSLQGAYATFVGRDGLTLERYIVYAGLKRSGYIVQRAATWYDEVHGHANGFDSSFLDAEDPSASSTTVLSLPTAISLIQRLFAFITTPRRGPSCPATGPLLAPGLYRSYNDIFRALALIPHYATTPTLSSPPHPKPPFTIAFDVWKPSPNYKKSAPPPPNYRVCIVDARSTRVPTLTQIGELLDSMPYAPVESEEGKPKRIETRMKHGKRSAIVAIVDNGVISYIRFAEGESGAYKLYEDKVARSSAQKGGGGRGGGGNRGRGGGRGGRGGRGGKR
jgi:tRNA-splicing endonuclease subunit Sen54